MTVAPTSSSARVLRLCLIAFVIASAIYGASPPVADNDLWGHVYFGRAILDAGGLPASNQYSYTSPDHRWINHEILAECIFAMVYDRFGCPGLLVLKLLLGLVTVALMARAAARRSSRPLHWAMAVAVCALLMSWGYLVRPQIFTFLALALLWERLGAHESAPSWSTLAALPLIFALWVNTHGGVLAGIGVLGIYAAAALPVAGGAVVAGIALMTLLSLLANPYGIDLPLFLVEDLSRSRPITEWQPILLLAPSHVLFKTIVVALGAGLLLNRRRRPWEVVTLALAVLLTFRHQRHLPLFAILAAPLLTETLESAARKARQAGLPPLSAFSHFLLGAGVLAVAAFEITRVASIYRELRWQVFVSPQVFPVHAVDFIKRNDLAGNLLLPFDWGEYAIWHLYPRCRVSVDGRYTTAYPDTLLDESLRFDQGTAGWEKALTNASLVLVSRRQPIVQAMFSQRDWVYVYSDSTALLFLRREIADSRAFDRQSREDGERALFFP